MVKALSKAAKPSARRSKPPAASTPARPSAAPVPQFNRLHQFEPPETMPSVWSDPFTFKRLAHASRMFWAVDRQQPIGVAASALLPSEILARRPEAPIDEPTGELSLAFAEEAVTWFGRVRRPSGQTVHFTASDGAARSIQLNARGLTLIVRSALWMGVLGVSSPTIRAAIGSFLQITGQPSERTVRHWRVAALRQVTDSLNAAKVPVKLQNG